MVTVASAARVPFVRGYEGVPADAGIVQQAIKNEVDLIIVGELWPHRLEETPLGAA